MLCERALRLRKRDGSVISSRIRRSPAPMNLLSSWSPIPVSDFRRADVMPRDLPISNGSLMINFDREYNIRDVYYPHVGQENQTVGDISFFGVECDGVFAWIGNPAWQKRCDYESNTLVTRVRARSDTAALEMQ